MMSEQLLQPGTRSARGRRILDSAPLRLVAATVTMPNRGRRPFQPQGHSWSREFEQTLPGSPESDWADDAACRAELQRVQRGVHAYAVGFARPAGVREAESAIGRIPSPRAPDDRSERSGSPAASSTRDPR
ncbi:hypothetical protein ACFCZ1_21995 [Streptomyces sp. NPDC056224]|uniref:hypothetical protein n=1 Tax=Streptomyces sp. NPDC056224 TaxID=3345750 RepID=UPI0035E2FD4B